MEKIMQTAPCRFCGQMVQIEADGKLTQPQAEEKGSSRGNLFGRACKGHFKPTGGALKPQFRKIAKVR